MITQLLDQSILDVRGVTLFVDRGTKISRIRCVPEMGLTVYRTSVRSEPPAYRGYLDILRLSNGYLRITLSTIISTELYQAYPEVYPPHLIGETTTTFPTIEEVVCHARIFWIRFFKTQGWMIEGVEASPHLP